MTQPITAAFPDELIPWMDATVRAETYRSRSQLIVEAVRHLRTTLQGHGELAPSLTFESQAAAQDPKIAELRNAIEEVLAVEGLPIVTPGKSSRKVDAAIATNDVRQLDILREEFDIPHKTTADLVRAFVRVGLQALDNMKKVEHPAWRAMGLAAHARAEHETRLMYEAALEERSADFHQDLVADITRGDDQEALRHYADFYRFAEALPLHLRDDGFRVLAQLPIAQEVAFRYPGLVPDPELVPKTAPNPMSLSDATGLYHSQRGK